MWVAAAGNWGKRTVKVEKHPQDGRRGSRLPSGRRWALRLLSLLTLITVCEALVIVTRRFPFEALLAAVVLAVFFACMVLYIGELIVLGWIVDFLSELGMPKIQARPIPLQYERIGQIVVVTLRDNVSTVLQCQLVQQQLTGLIAEHHCDFVLDFSCVGRVSKSFRGVMIHFIKAARKEAGRLGKPYRSIAEPHGKLFTVFGDRQCAIEEMSQHDGHGWVVLCSVPAGVRAVSEPP
jgi:hypothetical protein